ncbi:MAG: hypothetical protein JST04_02935 [Bdellovibrionales bacterium]|nr:hypothetical protein [Bdellovibrionales bacterium]
MSRLKPLFFHAFIALAVAGSAQAGWVFDRAAGPTLIFKNDQTGKSETLKTDGPNPNFIAVLTDPESSTPYALYEGKTCANCDASNTSVFIQRLDGKGKTASYVYPGRITDPKKGLVYQGRAFYGNCLPKVKAGFVAHQLEHVDRRGMQKSVLIAEPGPQYVYEVLLERRLPNVKTTLDLVKRKVCFEIAGRTRTVLKKPLNLTPQKGLDDNDDEEDDSDKKDSAADTPADAPTAGKD